jgi:hypothetical protein
MAYSLLGVFEVNMPLLYGEGGDQAFERLQLEIIKRSGDESIFAFSSTTNMTNVLARFPGDFAYSAGIHPFEPRTPRAPYSCTLKGLEISTILLPSRMYVFDYYKTYFMPLNCAREGALKPMAVRLGRFNNDEYFRTDTYDPEHDDDDGFDHTGRYIGLKWPEEADLDLQADVKIVKIHIINSDYLVMRKYWDNSINDENIVESLRAAVDKYMPDLCENGKIKDEKKAIKDSI